MLGQICRRSRSSNADTSGRAHNDGNRGVGSVMKDRSQVVLGDDMSTSISDRRPSAFPRLDTLTAEAHSQRQQSVYQCRKYSYTANIKGQPRGKTGILQGYSRFIAALTGEEEVCFQFALRNDYAAASSSHEVFAAEVLKDGVEITSQPDGGEAFDFGLELLADLDDFDFIDSLSLECPFVVQYHVAQLTAIMHYDARIMDATFADAVFAVLIKEISRTNDDDQSVPEEQLSVINHPPGLRPTQPERPRSLHAGFQRAAAQYPSRYALHFQSTDTSRCIFTYGELDSLSSALAVKLRNYISTWSSQPVVPAFMASSPAFYVSWLAVLKAGFTFCPLPMDAPSQQLRDIVEELGASFVLTNGTLLGGCPWDAWYCDDDELATCIDVAEFIKNHKPHDGLDVSLPTVSEKDVAYIMYTSGSTGRPKGVIIQHLAAAASIASHSKFISPAMVKDGFRWFQFAAPTFDPSIMEIFTTWWNGGTLCGAPREMLLTDPEAVINKTSATIMMATPSMASVLRPEKLHVRQMWVMGEKLTPRVISNFASDSPLHACPETHTPSLQRPYLLRNFYGPTEATMTCTVVPDFSVNERGSIIGRSLDTCSIFVIDPNSRQPSVVPLGFSGELAVGGPQVSQGYLNRIDQTAAAFVSSSKYGRLYRTGDRARIVRSRNGELFVEFLGRITTDQVKLSGRRVELGHIEAVISGVAGVSDVVAIVHQDGVAGQGSEHVVACIIADHTIGEGHVRIDCEAAAEKGLPQYMRPAKYLFLDEMPRSRAGKTDRKALASMVREMIPLSQSEDVQDPGEAGVDDQTRPLFNTIKEALYAVCNVSVGSIAPHTDLLSLGLDSLRAVRFLQEIRDRGITSLTVNDVLKIRTPIGLANHCLASGQSTIDPSRSERTVDLNSRIALFDTKHRTVCASQLGISPSEIEQILPTTATQSGTLASFLRSLSSDRKSYINHSVYHQAPGHDGMRVEQAWRTTLSSSKMLRAVFASVDDEVSPFAQCVLDSDASRATLEFRRYSCVEDTENAWNLALETARAEAEAAMSLDRPPLGLAVISSAGRTAYLLSLFHGIFDGGSLQLILRDVEDAFFSRPPAPRTEIDAAVYAHFSQASEETVAYWQAQFKDYELNPFPCVSPLKPESQSPAAQVTEVVGNVTLDKIRDASRAISVSPLSLLQAAWSNMLFAYTGSTTEISFGSVISDRLEEELSSCMGPTFVVVPFKLGFAQIETKTSREVLSALTSRNAEALPHHHIPLSSLATADGGLPYDTLLAFQAFDKPASDALWQSIDYPAMENDFAVMIEIWPTEAGPLRLRATYTHKHLDQSAAKVMLHQFDDLLSHLCSDPDGSFQAARHAVRSELQSQTPIIRDQSMISADPGADLYLHQPFERRAVELPGKPALVFKRSMDGSVPDVEWSYGELHSLASRFASRLLEAFGPVQNEPIMICMEKCPELYVAILGILIAGAAWCPIDPYSPPLRQRTIMERTGSRILVSSSKASQLDESAIPEGVSCLTLNIADLQSDDSKSTTQALSTTRYPSSLAYLIFTSGTTGPPKGVPITHLSAATAIQSLADTIPSDVSGQNVRCMQFSQYTFDVFVQDVFYTFAVGGTIISSTREIMLQSFADLANETKATHAHLTPAFAATLSRNSIETLEIVTMLGEKLPETIAEEWSADMRIFNTYGPAESTVISTVREINGKTDAHPSSNIGIPLPSVGAYVIDGDNVVMRGAIGELALAGPQLSSGYWHLPEVTAKKFVWNEQLQLSLYLTGDLVRQVADGTINFIGRNDDLVKLGGQRVELGEIAFALKGADTQIDKVEVLLCKRKSGDGQSVVAFLSCPSLGDSSGTVSAIVDEPAKKLADITQEHARAVLPPFMQPSAYIILNGIPRTASAKVDRAVLTTIYHSVDLDEWQQSSPAATSSANDQEDRWFEENRAVLSIIAATLAIPPESLRPTIKLPSLGIDSIAAIRLVPKINKLGFKISVVDVFQCKTVSDLCSLTSVDRTENHTDEHPESVLQDFHSQYYRQVAKHLSLDDISVLPTTVLQESLLSESLKDPDAYWSSHMFQLQDGVNLANLKRSWDKVTRRTEALRAGFLAKAALHTDTASVSSAEHGFLQIIYDEPLVDWSEHTITANITEAARKRVSEIAQYHHDALFKLPPWAVDIFHHDTSPVMMITVHHSIYDGPSLEHLQADLMAYYDRSSQPAQRFPLSEAIALKSVVNADNKMALKFWKESLENFASVTGEQDDGLGDQHASKLQHRVLYSRSSVSFPRLREAMVDLGLSSIVTILRMAWGIALANILESSQVLFAEVVSDRIMDSRLETAIGPLVSIVPSLFTPDSTISGTLNKQDSFAKQAWKHRNVRPGTIKNLLNRGATSQVYPAMFAFHPSSGDTASISHERWCRLEDVTDIQVEHPLAFNVWQDSDDCPKFELAVADSMMSEAEQYLLLDQLDALVQAIVARPNAPLTSVTGGMPTALISKTTPRPDTRCPARHSPTYWVEHWAKTKPDWIAAEIAVDVGLDGTHTVHWSYSKLLAESNRIARMILGRGFTARRIGMCLGRTLMSFAVSLGVLISGNTYLPIDEAFPAERKAFLLKDSGAAMVFTTKELFGEVPTVSDCELMDVDTDNFKDEFSATDSSIIPRQGVPASDAYLLYTSGSTGKPKGVLVSQENLASFVEAQSEFIIENAPATNELGGRGKYLGIASRAFDVHIGEMFLAWRHGLAIVTGNRSMLLDDLALALSSLHISHASFVPSLLDQTGLSPEDAPDLVFLGVGGEKMSAKTKKKWGSHDRVSLINAYGPTEATIGCCSGRVYPDSDVRDIGMPLGDSVGHVLVPGTSDYALRGMAGELCFTGSLIANGYLNRPDAKGFIDDFHGNRMYRTGDIVRLTIDDHIHFLGRKDDQVKIRGQRVELGEVAEGVRMASENAVDVAALVVRHPELSRVQLVAFIARTQSLQRKTRELPKVIKTDLEEANSTLRSKCQSTLPAYMVPDLIVPLDHIPLAATSGKSDSKLLIQVFSSIPITELMLREPAKGSTKSSTTRAMNEIEKKVLDVIASVMKDKPQSVSPSTSVFELGIDSLAAISVFSKLRGAGFNCSVAMVMRNPTIEQLAQSSTSQNIESSGIVDMEPIRRGLKSFEDQFLQSPGCNIDPEQIATVLPCLPMQEVLVGSAMHDDSYGAYINHTKFAVGTDVDITRLREAWESLVRNNEILRTCFSTSGDAFVQIVLKPDVAMLDWTEFSVESSASIASIQELAGRDIVQNLQTKPPMRLNYLPTSNGGELLFSISHAIYDGNSLEIMFRDIESYYKGQKPEVRLNARPLVEYISSQPTDQAQQHWTSLLDGWEAAPLLSALTHNKDVSLSTSKRQFRVKLSKLENDALSRNVTFATLLQAAFAISLSQVIRTNDFIFGNVLSGRTIPVDGADKILAPCVTTVPQRVKLEDLQISIAEFLLLLQESNSASLEFQHVSPRAIQRWLKADRPLYDVLFSFIRTSAPGSQDKPLLQQQSTDIAVDYPLAVEFEASEGTDGLVVSVGFTDAFGTAMDAQLLLERIETLTETILERSELTLQSLGVTGVGAQRKSVNRERYDESSWSPLESQLRALISEFTTIPLHEIHKDMAFIHLGVDSISAIRLAKHLRKAGLKVSSADVIRHNRLGALSNHLKSTSERAEEIDKIAPGLETAGKQQDMLPVLAAAGVKDLPEDAKCYECTPLQAGMLAQSLATDGALYMHHHAIECNPDIDLDRLKQAWDAVTRDVDVMRTTFHWLPKHTAPWVAVVHPDKRPTWEDITVSDAREHWLQLSNDSDFTARIQSAQPLAGVQIVNSKERSPVLILSLHHAIYDGVSLGMVYRQLSMRYHNVPTPQLIPFHEAAKTIVRSADTAADFWAEHVKGYEGTPPAETTDQFNFAERVVTSDVSSLEHKCRTLDLYIKDVVIVAFGKAMMKSFARRDVVFGQVLAARASQLGDGDVVGPVFNTVPFRVALNDVLSTNKSLVDTAHAVDLDSIELQHASLADVQKRWRKTTTDPSASLIDSIFVYSKLENSGEHGLDTLGRPLESDKVPVASEYRLNFEVEHTATGLTARALSSAPSGEIENLLKNFAACVHDIVDHPDRFAAAHPEGLRDLPLELKNSMALENAEMSFNPAAVDQYANVIRKAMADVAEVPADSIALDSSIYSFGVDSIAAIQIVSRCRKAGVRISVAQILKGAVLGRICEIVAASAKKPTKKEVASSEQSSLISTEHQQIALATLNLLKDAVEEILPCLPGQEYHLMGWLQSGRTLYEPGWIFRANLDAGRLRSAWRKLRERHAILRTTFAAVAPDQAVQVVMKHSAIQDDAFEVHQAEGSLVDAVKARAYLEARSPSNMFSLPIRLRLVQAEDGDAIMLYCHHVLYDAWSMPKLIKELEMLYLDQEVENVPSFSQLVRHIKESIDKEEEKAFWKESSAGCERAVIPASGTVTTDELDRRQIFSMAESTSIDVTDLETLCNKHNLSPHHILLLAFARAVAVETDTTSPLFGFFQLGRSTAFDNIETVTGPCVNTLPLGLPLPLTRNVLESSRNIQALLGARVPYEQSSLRTAVEAIDSHAHKLPFNAFINVLWNTKSLVGDVNEGDLFQPMAIGVPTDYSSPRALVGKTAVDGLDASFLPEGCLFVDVGRRGNQVVFGARADANLMSEEKLGKFIQSVERQVVECLEGLRSV